MRLPPFPLRARRLLSATFAALLLAATTITAQYGVFDAGFEGEIWELITTLDLPEGGPEQCAPYPGENWASGVAWVNGELFEVDNYSGAVNKFDSTLAPVDTTGADWHSAAGSITCGWAPNEATTADVKVDDGPVQPALLVSDFNESRIFAFTPAGDHLFTLKLTEPDGGAYWGGLNGVAVANGSYFWLQHPAGDPTLQLVGTMAAAWPEYYGEAQGGTLVFTDPEPFTYDNNKFVVGAPDHVLTGSESGDPSVPAVKAVTGVAFDTAGNLYMIDSWTARLHGYRAGTFAHMFSFGTPDLVPDPANPGELIDAGTVEFGEPYGMALWPSADGDRLLITDPVDNRAVVYRPRLDLPQPTIEYLFKLDGLGAVSGLPHSSAFDPVNQRVAVSDSAENNIKVFQSPSLAVFDLQVLQGGQPVALQSVACNSEYQVRFSLTVPAGRSALQLITPVLSVNGVLIDVTAVNPQPGGDYGNWLVGDANDPVNNPPLQAGQVLTFTYDLVSAPPAGAVDLVASATASTISEGAGGEVAAIPGEYVFEKTSRFFVTGCDNTVNIRPTTLVTPELGPEPSGWTKLPVPALPTDVVNFNLQIEAQDVDGHVLEVHYQQFDANPTVPRTHVFPSATGPFVVPITLTRSGTTTIVLSAIDDDFEPSLPQTYVVRLDNSRPGTCFDLPLGAAVQKSASEFWWKAPVTIPVTRIDYHDPAPFFTGALPPELDPTRAFLYFANEGAGQFATLTVQDHVGHTQTLPSNTSLDVCGRGWVGRNINIDMTKPAASGNLAEGPLYAAPAALTITGQDIPAVSDGSSSGVRFIDYSFNNFATFTRVTGASATVMLASTTTIQFRAVDWAGNAGDPVVATYRVNTAPQAIGDAYATNEDTPFILAAPGVLGNDTDADGSALTAALVSGPAHGTLTFAADGSFTYTPAPNYAGADSFTYKASDGLNDSNVATVTLTVSAVNDAPVAADDAYSVNEDTVLVVPAAGVLGNDFDIDSDPASLSPVLVAGPAHGVLAWGAHGAFTYTPHADYHGSDSFTYRASDGSAESNIATVTITVNPVADAPAASGDSYVTDEDTPLAVPAPGVLGNDADADGSPLTAQLVTAPAHGTLTLHADGSFTYVPGADYNGPDSFTYRANDGTADSNPASVSIEVRSVNDAPVAANDAYATDEDTALHVPARGVLVNDTDVDSGLLTLTAALVAGPSHGALTLNADGSFTYTPAANYAGGDSFTYRAGDGAATSNIAVVVLTVRPVNDPPVAVNDEVSTAYGTAAIIAVLANDTASDAGDTIAVQSVSDAVGGTATVNADGTVTFVPAAGFSGAGGFLYTVIDGGGLTAAAAVSVTVRPANVEPICSAAVASADLWPANHKASYVTVTGVVDPEGLPVTVTFTSILQDEPTNSIGQGNTLQDGGIEMNGARAWVRAERSGTRRVPGDGRVYLVGFTATDAGGLSCTGTVRLDVPHDQRGAAAVLSRGRWNSLTGQIVTPP